MFVNKQQEGKELTRVLNDVLKKYIPEDRKGSHTEHFFNGKGDALKCVSSRGRRFPEHGMKVIEEFLAKRLRRIIRLDKCLFGLCPGRSVL